VRYLGDGQYECINCGATFVVEGDVLPHTTTVAVSGAPIQRLTTVDGTEVHRCAISN